MELSLFDLHCDTAYEMWRQKEGLFSNSLAISLENARFLKEYVQIMALWADNSLSDEEGWNTVLSMAENLKNDAALKEGKALLSCRCPERPVQTPTLLFSVEDARILNGKIERLDRLYRLGVRILTPLWKGVSCIGGAHDSDTGLTPFGKNVVEEAVTLGMIPDISHASLRSAEEIFEIAFNQNHPVIASHSDLYAVCPTSRNLRKNQVERIIQCGGIIGINFHTEFLCDSQPVTVKHVLNHIYGFYELGAEDMLCIGGDMDGAVLPSDLKGIADLPNLAEAMLANGFTEVQVRKLFFENAYSFAKRHLIS